MGVKRVRKTIQIIFRALYATINVFRKTAVKSKKIVIFRFLVRFFKLKYCIGNLHTIFSLLLRHDLRHMKWKNSDIIKFQTSPALWKSPFLTQKTRFFKLQMAGEVRNFKILTWNLACIIFLCPGTRKVLCAIDLRKLIKNGTL